MKALIIQLNARMAIESRGEKYLELMHAQKYLKSYYKYDVVDIAEKKIAKSFTSYLNIDNVNFNDYDDLIIINSPINFYGGVISSEVILKIKKLIEFNGNIFYLLTDPELFYKNIALAVYEKDHTLLSIDDVKIFSERMSNAKVLFTGYDYDLYCKVRNIKNPLKLYENIKLFEFIFSNIDDVKCDNIKKYDLIYYGANRNTYRQKMLSKYFNENKLNKLLIGMNAVEFNNTTQIRKVDHQSLLQYISKSKYNLCIGDKSHNNNWITLRFFEGIICKTINFIDVEYDTNKVLYKDPLLQTYCYVTSISDVYEKISEIEFYNLYDDIIDKQIYELNRLTKNN